MWVVVLGLVNSRGLRKEGGGNLESGPSPLPPKSRTDRPSSCSCCLSPPRLVLLPHPSLATPFPFSFPSPHFCVIYTVMSFWFKLPLSLPSSYMLIKIINQNTCTPPTHFLPSRTYHTALSLLDDHTCGAALPFFEKQPACQLNGPCVLLLCMYCMHIYVCTCGCVYV